MPTHTSNPSLRRSRAGFTLIETLISLVVAGLLMSIGLPRMRAALLKANVRGARTAVIALYQQARGAALESRRTVTVQITSGTALVTARPRMVPGAGSYDTIGRPLNLATRYSVTVTGNPSTTLVVDPRGF